MAVRREELMVWLFSFEVVKKSESELSEAFGMCNGVGQS